jgi:hypothetical protein
VFHQANYGGQKRKMAWAEEAADRDTAGDGGSARKLGLYCVAVHAGAPEGIFVQQNSRQLWRDRLHLELIRIFEKVDSLDGEGD